MAERHNPLHGRCAANRSLLSWEDCPCGVTFEWWSCGCSGKHPFVWSYFKHAHRLRWKCPAITQARHFPTSQSTQRQTAQMVILGHTKSRSVGHSQIEMTHGRLGWWITTAIPVVWCGCSIVTAWLFKRQQRNHALGQRTFHEHLCGCQCQRSLIIHKWQTTTRYLLIC